jgi:ribokinase
MTNQKILVIGSSNTDMVVKTQRFPKEGETIVGGDFFMFPGGKGANQAVAAARLQGNVTFICKIGDDIFGKNAVEGFAKEGININNILTSSTQPSGVALITVDASGQNEIVVALGANGDLSVSNLEKKQAVMDETEVLLIQLEIPLSSVEYAVHYAQSKGKKVIINPAPAQELPKSIYKNLFLITPNATETEILTGIEVHDAATAQRAAEQFKKWGVQNVIITMGEKGVFVSADTFTGLIPTEKVQAIDTTAAGDVFNGALSVAIAEGKDWQSACAFACKAATISVTRMGAQASAPYLYEV